MSGSMRPPLIVRRWTRMASQRPNAGNGQSAHMSSTRAWGSPSCVARRGYILKTVPHRSTCQYQRPCSRRGSRICAARRICRGAAPPSWSSPSAVSQARVDVGLSSRPSTPSPSSMTSPTEATARTSRTCCPGGLTSSRCSPSCPRALPRCLLPLK